MSEIKSIESKYYYVFGAGNIARKVKSVLENSGRSISSFIVTYCDGANSIDGVQIKSLSELNEIDFSIPVIIAVFNREPHSNLKEIIRKLKICGFSNIISYPEFHSIYSELLKDDFWLTEQEFYSENLHNFDAVLGLFHDKASIENYGMIIDYLQTFNADLLKDPDFENQYFPRDIDVWDGKGAFIDIGSYDGNDIVNAFNRKGKLDTVVAFEPDLLNFNKLSNNQSVKNCSDNLFLYPCGVWSKTTHLYFNTGNGESSSIDTTGNQLVPVVKPDEILKLNAGYVKFDVEGAEIEGLKGLYNIIDIYRPSLAVSLYHRPDHFYSIPLLINEWNLGYKFYVRLHANNLFDTVLYCVK
jgi:FkbM family methyltransferase